MPNDVNKSFNHKMKSIIQCALPSHKTQAETQHCSTTVHLREIPETLKVILLMLDIFRT